MALHQIDQILHQQIALYLHDGRRRRAYKQHQEIITRIAALLLVFFIELSIVKSNFQRRTCGGQVVQSHAHLIQSLAKIVLTLDGPTYLKNMVIGVKTNAGFFLVKAVRAFAQ